MTDLVKKAESFITFHMPLQAEFISFQFGKVHGNYKSEHPNWSVSSTRQKLIASYWTDHVLKHFLGLFSLAALVVIIVSHPPVMLFLSGMFLAIAVVSPVLISFLYWPNYQSDFLPKLEMVKENFENVVNEELEKCRQAQLSNFALALIFYVFDKVSCINTLQYNDKYSELLMQLYGVDKGSLKKNLELILGRKRELPPRKHTEICNRIEEARTFLKNLQFPAGVKLLDDLERKFQQ